MHVASHESLHFFAVRFLWHLFFDALRVHLRSVNSLTHGTMLTPGAKGGETGAGGLTGGEGGLVGGDGGGEGLGIFGGRLGFGGGAVGWGVIGGDGGGDGAKFWQTVKSEDGQ